MHRAATNIYEFIEEIRVSPSAYLGKASIKTLENLLFGYREALDVHCIEEVDVPPFHYFTEWLYVNELIDTKSLGWAKSLLIKADDNEVIALEDFFQLAIEFGKLHPQRGKIYKLAPGQGYSPEFLRWNKFDLDPIPNELQIIYLNPGAWCYLKYCYGNKFKLGRILYSNAEQVCDDIEREFDIRLRE